MRSLSLRTVALSILCALTSLLVMAAPQTSAVQAAAAAKAQPAEQHQQQTGALDHKVYLPLTPHLYDPTYINPFGIVMYGNIDPAHGLNHVQVAGAKRVTTMLDWGTVQPNEQTWDWSSFDTKVRNAQAAGMEVFALFTGDPAWAWKPDRTATIPEKRLAFVRAMVQRYDCDGSNDAPGQLCVHDWSFYAEPDFYVYYYQDDPGIKGYWGQRGAEYAHMLADVANVIHTEDRGARVMIGGLAYDGFMPPNGSRGFVREFLPTVLATLNTKSGGAGRYVDAVAVHYYPLLFPSIRDKILEIRGIMHSYGVGHLPVLVPESGYWSAEENGSSETIQAQRVVQSFVEALAVGVQEISYFTVFDSGAGMESSGLFRGRDLNSPKLAYYAYHVVIRELNGAEYPRPLNQPGVDGYVFSTARGTEKTVLWGSNAAGTATFGLRCARVVEKSGTAAQRYDGGAGDADGVTNGQLRIGVAANEPLYVEACP